MDPKVCGKLLTIHRRGYGDDAKGFCIGYRVKDFCKLPVHLLKIEYEFKKQYTLLIDTMYSIEKEIADGINETNAHLICELLEVFSMMRKLMIKCIKIFYHLV